MSTGADCRFYEKTPGQWFYDLQQWPYGESTNYDTSGPFGTFREAYKHLHDNNANPGGFFVSPLPGCKHDLLTERKFDHDVSCDRCGEHLSAEQVKKAGGVVKPDKTDEEEEEATRRYHARLAALDAQMRYAKKPWRPYW
jgi:hypothetical protein